MINMAFDLKRWQSQVHDWWARHGPRLKTVPIDSAYALLAASAWLPFLAAYAQEPGPATTALVGVTAGLGSNLVANVVQRAYDRARGGEQVIGQVREDAQTRAELDAVLQATRTLEAAQDALGERWDTFARQLAQEMAALPGRSSLIVTLGDGTVVGGSVIAGDLTLRDSTFVGGNQITIQGDGNVAGDGSQATVIKTGDHSPVTLVEDTRDRDEDRQRERALHGYLERLASECNVLHLRGMDPRAADVTRQETMSLAAVYTALDTNRRVPLSDEELAAMKERERGPMEIIGEGRRGERPQRPMSALEVASRCDQLVLLGKPGAGKSTFVNHLALRLAQAALRGNGPKDLPGWTRGPLVPVRIILRDLASSPHLSERGSAAALWDFVTETLAKAHLADAAPALRERLDGRALLLLDGLDEVEAGARQRVLEAVADLALTYRHVPILVTCRVYAYQEPAWRLPGFDEATLAPFDEERMDHFIVAWYAEVARMGMMSASEAGERAARLRDAVRRPDLRTLAPNPLLLTMMALLHSSWGRLPEDRVQLYSEIVELLLARWEQSRLGRETLTQARLSPRDLRFALEEVAYVAHGQQLEGEGTADVAEPFLRRVLQEYLEGDWNRAGDMIRYIRERAGLLLERKPGVYGFPHRTLQEYLAGCYLSVQTGFPSQVADLVRDDETRWREPFLLAVAKTARAENRVDLALAAVDNLCPRAWAETPLDEQAYRCAWLAGEALLEVGVDTLRRRDAWAARLERVTGWLAGSLEAGALKPVERAAAGRVLAQLGDPRDLDAVVFVPGGPFTMGSGAGDEQAYDDERPQHTVELAGFYIGRYPVTNGQYGRFVQAGGYDERRYWTEAGWAWRTGAREPDLAMIEDKDLRESYADWLARRPPEKRNQPFWWDDPAWNLPNHPVVGVCWFEALAYTRWLTERLQVSGFKFQVWLDGKLETRDVKPGTLIARLPTEAEWEKVARGTEGWTYPWGDEWAEDRANTSEANVGRTTAVGAFPAGASPYGVLDMSGNVWEWCSSVGYTEAKYPYQPDDGREDLEQNTWRTLRGGSWYSGRKLARCASRSSDHPGYFGYGYGFRVVFPGSPPSDF